MNPGFYSMANDEELELSEHVSNLELSPQEFSASLSYTKGTGSDFIDPSPMKMSDSPLRQSTVQGGLGGDLIQNIR